MKIIDIHSHILPCVDDGAQSLEESLELLRDAYDNGIRAVIATPHHSKWFQNDDVEALRKKHAELSEAAMNAIGEDIEIYLGMELMYSTSAISWLKAGKALTMCESNIVMLEFQPYNISFNMIFGAVREVISAGYTPMLAHIERYDALDSLKKVEELIEAGALTQINYEYVGIGGFGKYAKRCKRLLKSGNVHFLGTDMHNKTKRPPNTGVALAWMKKHLESEYIEQICHKNAYWYILHPTK